MTDDERKAKLRAKLALDRAVEPLKWWWLSFADPARPKGTQFLGVMVIQAQGIGDACHKAHLVGYNPGGEVVGRPFPDWAPEPPQQYRNRLLTKIEAADLGRFYEARKPS